MPKPRTATSEHIVEAALGVLRAQGFASVNARSVATAAGCSVQPIYAQFGDMAHLFSALYARCCRFVDEYIARGLASHAAANPFESLGFSHVRLAREERNLFVFVYLSPYAELGDFADLYQRVLVSQAEDFVEGIEGVGPQQAQTLYLQLVLFTHGIASLIATGAADFSDADIHAQLDAAYDAFVHEIQRKAGVDLARGEDLHGGGAAASIDVGTGSVAGVTQETAGRKPNTDNLNAKAGVQQ